MHIWESESGNMIGVIECRDDLSGGRLRDDRVTAKNSTRNKYFNSIAVSPNGDFLIGGGNSKNVCFYDIKHRIMLRRFAVT
jgi:periodic tryptophan protein 2